MLDRVLGIYRRVRFWRPCCIHRQARGCRRRNLRLRQGRHCPMCRVNRCWVGSCNASWVQLCTWRCSHPRRAFRHHHNLLDQLYGHLHKWARTRRQWADRSIPFRFGMSPGNHLQSEDLHHRIVLAPPRRHCHILGLASYPQAYLTSDPPSYPCSCQEGCLRFDPCRGLK